MLQFYLYSRNKVKFNNDSEKDPLLAEVSNELLQKIILIWEEASIPTVTLTISLLTAQKL